jgi:hypothetical protein
VEINNNHIFEFCVPRPKDVILIGNNSIPLNRLLEVKIDFLKKNVVIKFSLDVNKQNILGDVFSFKGAIEFSPIECELKCSLKMKNEVIPFLITNVNYNANGHYYIVGGNFSLNNTKIYNDYSNNIKMRQEIDVKNSDNLGALIDLED